MQWKRLSEGDYVVGLEPANCEAVGRVEMRWRGGLEVLEPGARKDVSIEIGVLDGVAKLLKQKKMTQTALIAATDLSVKTVRAAVNGENVNAKSAELISKVLGVSHSELFSAEAMGETLAANTIRSYSRIISSALSC